MASALRETLPAEHLVYFGDTARVPYGSKSAATIQGFVRQVVRYLERFTPKHLVIACNTATALALPVLRQEFPQLPISGVIDPGAKSAVEACGSAPEPIIGVIGTEATIHSRAYERAIHRRRVAARVYLKATPLLVPMIEEGRGGDDPIVQLALQHYLAPMLKYPLAALLLGCTHYPILQSAIQKHVSSAVTVIDSAKQCAQDVARRLRGAHRLRASGTTLGTFQCFVTDQPPRFAILAKRFLKMSIDTPVLVAIDELYALERARQSVRTSA